MSGRNLLYKYFPFSSPLCNGYTWCVIAQNGNSADVLICLPASVYAWADGAPNELCPTSPHACSWHYARMVEHSALPQASEPLNHLLLLRQMIFRFECTIGDDSLVQDFIPSTYCTDLVCSTSQPYCTHHPGAFLPPHLIKFLFHFNHSSS